MTFLLTPFDLASYCTLVELNSGTGAPSADLRGTAAQGTYREWGPLEYDSTLAVIDGVTPFDLASYCTLVELNSGTGAPSADLRGTTVQGTYREWGPLEYDSTLPLVVVLYITPSGMAVGAVFGTAVIGVGVVDIAPDGIEVAVAFGTAVIGVGVVDIAPDGIEVAVAFGTAVIGVEAVDQTIAPEGLAVGLAMGDITVTRRAAVDVPLYVIDFDERVWTVPAESRLYYVEV